MNRLLLASFLIFVSVSLFAQKPYKAYCNLIGDENSLKKGIVSVRIDFGQKDLKDNKFVDENGKEFEQRIYINDVNPSSATVVEMRALEAHYKVEKQGGFTSLPLEAGNMGLNDRRDFISMFKKSIEDLNKLGRFDLSLLWTKSMDTYLNLPNANSKYK